MKTFEYEVKDELGLHARPAGLLVKATKATGSQVYIEKDGRRVSADRLLSLMGLGIRQGDRITVCIEGGDEASAETSLKAFLEAHL